MSGQFGCGTYGWWMWHCHYYWCEWEEPMDVIRYAGGTRHLHEVKLDGQSFHIVNLVKNGQYVLTDVDVRDLALKKVGEAYFGYDGRYYYPLRTIAKRVFVPEERKFFEVV
jgi:hypothetical protein